MSLYAIGQRVWCKSQNSLGFITEARYTPKAEYVIDLVTGVQSFVNGELQTRVAVPGYATRRICARPTGAAIAATAGSPAIPTPLHRTVSTPTGCTSASCAHHRKSIPPTPISTTPKGDNMQVNVTQNLAVRVVPVNNPNKYNEYGEPQGYYVAMVAAGTADWIRHAFQVAEDEWMRGIVSSGVGYGSAGNALSACEIAISDYMVKFGALCVTDSEEAW